MSDFKFINLKDCPEVDSICLSDLYHEAGIIDSPKKIFKDLSLDEQGEILNFYRSGKVFKILYSGEVIGFIGHGTRPSDFIMIFYIFLPEFRGKGLFAPMMDQFEVLCSKIFPEKKFLRANTEARKYSMDQTIKKRSFLDVLCEIFLRLLASR
jgi:hypothetical protein